MQKTVEKTIKTTIPASWRLVIQETKLNGILCFETEHGRIYVRVPEWDVIEKYTQWRLLPFEILTGEEMQELGISESAIQIQESFISKQRQAMAQGRPRSKKRFIEESVPTESEKPASMTEEEWQAFKKKQAEELKQIQPAQGVTINLIGSKPKEETERISNVENPKEISPEDVEIAKDIIKEGVERLRAEGHIIPPDLEPRTFEELKQLKQMFDAEHPKKPPAGSIPLSPAQTGEPEEGFENYEQMIDFLADKASKSPKDKESETANAILSELWRKMMAHQEETGKSFKYERKPKEGEQDKPLVEELNEKFRRRKGIKKEGEQ